MFGMVERRTVTNNEEDPDKPKRRLFIVVEKRNALILLNLIYAHVANGKIIYLNSVT